MKIQLIFPPQDREYNGVIPRELLSPPIGLELIAKAAEESVKDAQIEIIDGNQNTLDNILSNLRGDFVGVSSWYSNHRNALRILQKAKQSGAKTVIGGPNINHLAERVIRSHGFVDYAVPGDGEEAFSMLIAGADTSQIPNLVYRKENVIVINERRNVRLNRLFDLDHLDWAKYLDDIKTRQIPISGIRGCVKAETKGRCSFCSIDHSLKMMDPELFWQQVRLLNQKYGFDYFFETGDSFFVGNRPERLLAARPADLSHIRFRIYESPINITPGNFEILKKLNIQHLFLGLESVNDEALQRCGKTYSRKDIDRAIDMVIGTGIRVQIPFLYGLPGETLDLMEENYQYAKQVAKKGNNIWIFTAKAIPIVGSQLFANLVNSPEAGRQYSGDLERDDHFNYRQLVDLQTRLFTSVTPEQVSEYLEKTRSLMGEERRTGFGE